MSAPVRPSARSASGHSNKCWNAVFRLHRSPKHPGHQIQSPGPSDIFKHGSEFKVPIRFSRRSKTRRTAPFVHRFIRKARKSFSLVKNIVSKVFFDSLDDVRYPFEHSLLDRGNKSRDITGCVKTALSVICVLWHFLGLKWTFRFRSMLRAVKESLIKIGIHRTDGHIQFWMVCQDMIRGLSLFDQRGKTIRSFS